MAGLTIDPGRAKIIWMRSNQSFGIYLMVTIDALDREISYVHLMAKQNLTYRRRNIYFSWYLNRGRLSRHCLESYCLGRRCVGRQTGNKNSSHEDRCKKISNHNYLV